MLYMPEYLHIYIAFDREYVFSFLLILHISSISSNDQTDLQLCCSYGLNKVFF